MIVANLQLPAVTAFVKRKYGWGEMGISVQFTILVAWGILLTRRRTDLHVGILGMFPMRKEAQLITLADLGVLSQLYPPRVCVY